MSKRIRGSDVQLGESLVIGQPLSDVSGNFNDGALSKEELYVRLKEKEFKDKLDKMLEAAQKQATVIINDAKGKASQIIREAEQEIQKKEEELAGYKNQVREEAKQEGFQAGYKEGCIKGSQDIYSMVENLEAVSEATFKLKKEIILSAEQEILQLSVAIAERILKQQLEIKPKMINEIIKAAINELKDKDEIKIIINPALKEQLYSFSEELKTIIKGMKIVKIVEDKTIHPNSAIVESPESRIDARLETQIAKITEEIMKNFEEEPVLKRIIDK